MTDEPDRESARESDDAERPADETPDSPQESSALAAALVAPPEATREEAYEQRARLAEARVAEVLAAFRQFKEETERHKERTARTVERRFERRHEQLLLKFMEILDNFDRALDAAEQTYAGAPLIEGLILVRTQLLQTLQQEGLERMPVLGLPFDPAVAEAMGTQPVEDPEHDHIVVKEYQRGYRLFGRLARPARVVVGQHAAQAEETSAPPAPEPTEGLPAPEASGPSEAIPVDDGGGPPLPTPIDDDDQRAAAAEIVVDDHGEPLRPTPVDEGEQEPSVHVAAVEDEGGQEPSVSVTSVEDEGPSLEEIVARAEAQQALFGEAFGADDTGEHDAKPVEEEPEEA